MEVYGIAFLFFITALVYSSVGFGGGSTYTAILATMGFDYKWIRFLSLFCNTLVTGGNIIKFYHSGLKAFTKFLPFLLFSIPFAYWGGRTRVSDKNYMLILGGSLIIVAILMIAEAKLKENRKKFTLNVKKFIIAGISVGIGYLSGIVGIGGGVFLAPVLHLIQWDTPKQIAAIAGTYIFVNSIAGLSGQLQIMDSFPPIHYFVILGGSVIAGGFIGSNISVNLLSEKTVKIITGLLIGVIGIRLIVINL